MMAKRGNEGGQFLKFCFYATKWHRFDLQTVPLGGVFMHVEMALNAEVQLLEL
jgi:hypothetical protein